MNDFVIAYKFIAQGFFFLIGNKLAVKRTRETIQYNTGNSTDTSQWEEKHQVGRLL